MCCTPPQILPIYGNLQDSPLQACLKSVEISVDPDQLASRKPADLDPLFLKSDILRFSVPQYISKTDIFRFSIRRVNILDL